MCLLLFLLLPSYICDAQDSPKTISFVSDPIKEGGFIEEITVEAFKRVGYSVNTRYMPWVRALNSALTGTSDALLGATYTDARAEKLLYSDLVGKTQMLMFTLKNSGIPLDTDDFMKYRIGYIRGGWIPPALEGVEFEILNVTEWDQSIAQLIAGRIDMFVGLKFSVIDKINRKYPEYRGEIVALEKPLAEFEYYNCFPRDIAGSHERRADFNRGLRAIIADGTYDRIMSLNLHE